MQQKFKIHCYVITGEMIHVLHQDAGISCLVASKLKNKQDNVILFGDREGKLSYLDLETLQVKINMIVY